MNLIPYDFNSKRLQVLVDENGEPWFIAMEVAEILGYSDAYEMTKRLDEDEKSNRQIAGLNRGERDELDPCSQSGLCSARHCKFSGRVWRPDRLWRDSANPTSGAFFVPAVWACTGYPVSLYGRSRGETFGSAGFHSPGSPTPRGLPPYSVWRRSVAAP
ncbi:Bro-N domain-containing protein [Pseudomonas aeruginosa]|uniref:BRO-N domain-containing protein n=3 Tax=Pseudomonas aeruginosa TaxID=287 RepID=UPI000B011FEE|nr:BRO family protein [Pseudomonas aeruginosa]MCC0441109.1 hypothetical protein [Pseudomonas aeruginosa]MCV6456002.1 BRO family protein [Pseudomonas aeruginosa]MCV6484886.1 BRO family protein [Pseudomonas aeruginosa]